MEKVLLFVFLITSILFYAGCSPGQSSNATGEQKEVVEQKEDAGKKISEGIEVKAKILSNYRDIDEAMVEIELINKTDEIFSGTVTLSGGWFDHWKAEFRAVPPQSGMTKEVKLPYIENPADDYTISVNGDFVKQFESEVEYTILRQVETRAFYVQTEQVTEESAISIIKDLYSKHGEEVKHVSIYDMTLEEEIREDNYVIPKAEFYYNIMEFTLSINQDDGTVKTIPFELP